MSGFRSFVLRGNVVDLAVGIVIGAAFTSVVQALVKDFVTPLVGLLGGARDYSSMFFTLQSTRFYWGNFVSAVITFLIEAVILYFLVVLPYSRVRGQFEKAPEPEAPTKECPECLSKIPAGARRCAFCGSEVAVV